MRTLQTERLDLVPLDPDRDAESLHLMLSDPRMHEFGGGTPIETVADTRAQLADWLAGNGGWTWAIRLRPATEAIGTIGLFYGQGTPIRGLDRALHPDFWGRGIMSEAGRAAVDYLLDQPHIDGLEAWIDSRNLRSRGVARRAGLDLVARLPRVYDDHVAQQVVMARAAQPRDPDTLTIRPILPVRDVAATAQLLAGVLGLTARLHGEPPTIAWLGVEPWAGSPGPQLDQSTDDVTPVSVSADIGIAADEVHRRAVDAGLHIVADLEDKPWGRREFAFTLAEGHRFRVIGPSRPPHSTAD